jgi:octaprenyl-diphosphate synthase
MELYRKLIAAELRIFEQKFKDAVSSKHSLLDTIMRYVVKRKGKQLRPIFVFLSARMCGPINETTYRAASLVELLHTATLVHDDIVDDSDKRRGFFSINALWKNKIAVLVGDYLLSKGLLLSLGNQDYKILEIFTESIREMSEGELLQLEKSRKLNLDEATYFEIIKNKTASLLASCCAAGAASTTTDPEIINRFKTFGEKVGIAFQIKDDLFDYGFADIGKPTGNDIKQKKLTLPLIYTLNHISPGIRKEFIYTLKNNNKDKEKIKKILQTVKESGGIEYATGIMYRYKKEAMDLLYSFPHSEVRDALEDLVSFTTNRAY